MQLNMCSVTVTGEERQLFDDKSFEILLLQESYAGKDGTSGAVLELGTGISVASVRSECP